MNEGSSSKEKVEVSPLAESKIHKKDNLHRLGIGEIQQKQKQKDKQNKLTTIVEGSHTATTR
jgi:hypothetical protein